MPASAVGKFVAGFVAAFAFAVPSRSQAPNDSCPLPLAAQIKAITAFEPIHKFVMNEPRCVNCHGGVNPHIGGTGPDPANSNEVPSTVEHGGPVIGREPPDSRGQAVINSAQCMECHDGMAPTRSGAASRWFTAPPFLAFLDKDAPTLCKQFKRATGSAAHFIGHLEDDNGGNAFTKTAFMGNRGISGLAPQPPSISHAALIRMGREWIEAMGGQFKGGDGCGCEIRKIRGKFTASDHSPLDDVVISGDMTWKADDASGGVPRPGAPLVFKPQAGEITVHLKMSSPGVPVGRCEADDRRTFNVESLSRSALRYLKLEIEDDLRYRVMLVIRDTPDPFPTWTIDSHCTGPGMDTHVSSPVKYMSVGLGRQQGTIDPDRDIEGGLPEPIRSGVRTITGHWSFKADER